MASVPSAAWMTEYSSESISAVSYTHLVLDGYFAMSGMKIDPAKRQISGWVNNQRFVHHPETFRNYFVIQFDRPCEELSLIHIF